MIKISFVFVATLILAAGCGKINETTTTTDNNTINYTPPAALNCPNTIYLKTNGYGDCYDTNVLFPGATGAYVTESGKVWSIYMRSNTNDTNIFYDIYLRGYKFYGVEPGNVFKQEQTDGYAVTEFWGINDAGTIITTSGEGEYTYANEKWSDGCFKVTNNGKTLKMCHESLENIDANVSSLPDLYFGSNVKFGNRIGYDDVYNKVVVGTWSFAGYGANTTPEVFILFNEDGNSFESPSGNPMGDWGVSADGKIIGFNGARYLAYQYLNSSSCIVALELSGGLSTGKQWKLCKQ